MFIAEWRFYLLLSRLPLHTELSDRLQSQLVSEDKICERGKIQPLHLNHSTETLHKEKSSSSQSSRKAKIIQGVKWSTLATEWKQQASPFSFHKHDACSEASRGKTKGIKERKV